MRRIKSDSEGLKKTYFKRCPVSKREHCHPPFPVCHDRRENHVGDIRSQYIRDFAVDSPESAVTYRDLRDLSSHRNLPPIGIEQPSPVLPIVVSQFPIPLPVAVLGHGHDRDSNSVTAKGKRNRLDLTSCILVAYDYISAAVFAYI